MAVGFQQLSGQICNDEAEKGDRPHQCGGHGNAQRNAQQQAVDASVIVHTQVDRLIFSQREHIQ